MTKRYIKYFIFSVLFFSTINIVYQIAVVDNPYFNIYDLAVNLLSEFAGMIFTVLIFNEFITYRQQLANKNKFRMLYNDLDGLIKNLEFPFRSAVEKYTDNLDVDIWNKEIINMIRDRIVLSETDDCVFPAVPWYMIFSMQGDKIMRKCQNIRIQYQDILDPQISDHLSYLLNNSEMLSDLSDIKKIYENDLLLNYTRPQNLGSYFACPTDKDFEVIKKINDWLHAGKKENERQTSINKYNKIITIVLAVFFTLGAAGYYTNKSYFLAVLFTVIAMMLFVISISFFKKRKE